MKTITSEQAVALRKKTRLNQRDFWARVGVTQSGGSRYESGRNIPRPVSILVTIAYGNARDSAKALAAIRK